MRITILQGAFFPVPPILGGAVEKVWFSLGQEFARRGHEVTQISRRHPKLPERELLEGVEHIRVPGFDTPLSLAKLKLYDLLYTLRAKGSLPPADILVTNTFWAPLLIGKPALGKIYVHVARYPKGQFKYYGRAARFQPVSTHIGEAISLQTPGFASRVKAIPNPLPYREIVAPPVPKNTVPEILFVGRVHPEKGVHILLEAFSRLNIPATLRIVGPWEENFGGGGRAYFERLKTLSVDFADRVTFTGPVFGEEALQQIYAAADLFVYPSIADQGEALPLAPVEAMAAGCPPVVSRMRCFDDYLVEGENGFVFDQTAADPAESLRSTLHCALSDSTKRLRIREGCLATANRFTLPRVADLYLADFESLLVQ